MAWCGTFQHNFGGTRVCGECHLDKYSMVLVDGAFQTTSPFLHKMLIHLVLVSIWPISVACSLAVASSRNLKNVRDDELCAIPQVRYIDPSQDTSQLSQRTSVNTLRRSKRQRLIRERASKRMRWQMEEDWQGLDQTENERLKEVRLSYFKQADVPKQPLTKEQRLNIRKKWKENEAALILFHNDSAELSRHLHQYEHLEVRLSQEKRKIFSTAIEFLKESKQNIRFFKQLRLLELGGINTPVSDFVHMAVLLNAEQGDGIDEWIKKLPHDALYTIAKLTRKASARSYAEEIKKFILSYNLGSRKQQYGPAIFEGPLMCVYAFKMIDFLFKNGFINKADLQDFFQDGELFKRAIFSGLTNLYFKTGHLMYYIDEYTMKDWFWPLGFEFLRHITQEELEKSLLDYKITRIIFHGNIWNLNHPLGSWDELLKSLSSKKYLDKLQDLQKASHFTPINEHYKDPISRVQTYQEFGENVKRLMNHLQVVIDLNKDHHFEIIGRGEFILSICGLLEVIEKKFCPGIMSLVSKELNVPNEHLKDLVDLLLKYSRFSHSFKAAKLLKNTSHSGKHLINNQLVDVGFFWKYYSDVLPRLHSDFMEKYSEMVARNDQELSKVLQGQSPNILPLDLQGELLKLKPQELPSKAILPHVPQFRIIHGSQ